MSAVTYLEAIGQAIREEMQRDDAVFMLGEDVGNYGGAFKVSAGLLEEFGSERIIDTPMAEDAIIGSAVGRSLDGHEANRRNAIYRLHYLWLRSNYQYGK